VNNRKITHTLFPIPAVFAVLSILTLTGVIAYPVPERPQSAVADYAGLLSADVTTSLSALSNAVWSMTGAAIVLVTLKDLQGDDIDNTANDFYNKWGIGSKEKNEGVLVLLSLQERMIRIETGYGTEEYIPDVVSSRIIREAQEQFLSKNDWNGGLEFIMGALMQKIANHYGISVEQMEQKSGARMNVPAGNQDRLSPGKLLLIALLLLFLLGTPFGRSLLFLMLLNATSRGNSRYMSGGGWGGNSGGGGFGGFGGGRSGGGGASGRF